EHVPPVGLPVQAARGHAHVEVGGVGGQGLQDVEQVQVEHHGVLGVADGHVAAAPQVPPRGGVAVEQAGEVGGVFDGGTGRFPAVADRVVEGRVDGHDLLHRDLFPLGCGNLQGLFH